MLKTCKGSSECGNRRGQTSWNRRIFSCEREKEESWIEGRENKSNISLSTEAEPVSWSASASCIGPRKARRSKRLIGWLCKISIRGEIHHCCHGQWCDPIGVPPLVFHVCILSSACVCVHFGTGAARAGSRECLFVRWCKPIAQQDKGQPHTWDRRVSRRTDWTLKPGFFSHLVRRTRPYNSWFREQSPTSSAFGQRASTAPAQGIQRIRLI